MLERIIPGTVLNRVQVSAGPLKLHPGTVSVSLPARVHMSVLDMTRFSPRQPGGGGIGMAIALPVSARIRLRDSGIEIDSNRPLVVEHIARVVADFAGYEGGFELKVEDHGINHLGLGSSSAVMSATAYALNLALGMPLDPRDLRMMIGYNFVEEAVGERLLPGYETGVGPAAGFYGGFVVLSDGLELVARFPIEGRRALIAIPECAGQGSLQDSSNAGEEEHRLLSTLARELDQQEAPQKAREVLLNLIPRGLSGDIRGVGESVWLMQHLGSKVAEIRHHSGGSEIYGILESLRRAGAELVAMSSVGPSVIALAPKEGYGRLKDQAAELPIKRIIETEPDNQGVVWEKGG